MSLLLLLNKKFFLHFRFLRNLPTILFLYESIFLLLCYSCVFLRYLSGCFFVAMKFLVTNMRFLQAFLRFLQAISVEHNSVCLLKLRQKFVRKVLLQLAILIEFVIFAIFALFSTFLTVRFIFCAKIAKTICYQIFATVFNPGHKWRPTR